jgi:hypothetical protein
MGVNPTDRKFPWQGAGPSGPQGGATGDGGGGGGNRGGGSSRAAAPQSNLDRLRDAAKTDPRARAELMRLQNDQSQAMSRASDFRARGFFSSAASAEIRAEQRAEQQADKIAARNLATDRFGGSNMGEAFRNFREDMAKHGGSFAGSQKDFEKWANQQAKTEKQREQDQAASGSGAGAKTESKGEPFGEVVGRLDQIIAEITERLPQTSMA